MSDAAWAVTMNKKLTTLLLIIGTQAIARADSFEFTANLNGATEVPATGSPGTGAATVVYDNVANTLRVLVNFSGLESPTTASHIHAPTTDPFTGNAQVATTTPTFAGFPLGVTSGTYDNTLDLSLASSYNPAFVTAHGGTVATAEPVLIDALFAGESYLNIHTQEHPGGEIRGFLTFVPDGGSTAALLLMGIAAGTGLRRRFPR